MSPTGSHKKRTPRTEADFTYPDSRSDHLIEAKNYQAQLTYTVIVALGVAIAAISQTSILQNHSAPLGEQSQVMLSSGQERRPATLELSK